MSEPVIIGRIPKNSSETVIVSLSEFKGHRLIDIRVYAAFVPGEEPKPTKRGISLHIEKIDELVSALQVAQTDDMIKRVFG